MRVDNTIMGEIHEKRYFTMKKTTAHLALFLALILSLAAVLPGCSGSKEDSTQESSTLDSTSSATETDPEIVEGGSLIYGMTQDIVSLDPHQSTDAGTRDVVFNMYEGLVKPTPDGNLEPAVAQDYTISEDGTVYTFTLRDGITFHDGSPVTTADVKYSIERYAETQGEDSAFFSSLKSVETPDDKTVVVTLNEGDTEFLTQLTLAIIPQSNSDPAGNPIGTGPYKFVSYKAGESLELEKYDGYWKEDGAHLDKVTFKFIADVNTAIMELKAGSIDVLNYLTAAQVNELQTSNKDQFRIVQGNMNLVHALFLNNDYEPFKDVRVRQAMCYAVDRDAINQFLFEGKSTIIGTHMIPSLKTWYNEETASVYTYDTEKAKQLLEEAGYADGFDLEITVPSAYSQHVDTAQIIADQLSKVGIRVTINQVEWSSWLEDVYHNRNYQATVIGFDGKLNPSDWLHKYSTDADNNMTNYSNEDYDRILEEAESTTDQDLKAKDYKELEMNLAQNAASVYIEDPADFVALNANFAGYEFYPTAAWDVSKIYMVKTDAQ